MKKGILITIIAIIIIGITYLGIEMYGFVKGVKEDSQKQIVIKENQLIIPRKTKGIVVNEQIGEEELTICKEQSENGIEFKTCLKDYDFFELKSLNGKVLYRNDNNPYEFVFTDFNEDGFLDIELHFLTNVPDVNEILIFSPSTNSFIEIKNFSYFPSSVKIKNTNYYYSYHRSGCADSNWDSDLYYLEPTKAVRIGNISGIGCEGEYETGIFISKVINDEKKLVKKIEIDPKYYSDKWDFIKSYWTENYKLYE